MRLSVSSLLVIPIALTACTSENGDVTGPFTGTTHRYVVDSIKLPFNSTEAKSLAADLDGDRMVENLLGLVISTLYGQGDVTEHGADMIASGALASTVEIVADDLTNDPTVSVLFRGADGESATAMGGTFEDGAFVSNRTATTRVPGRTMLHLPVFIDADPCVFPLDNMQIDLAPDRAGGFTARIAGTVPADRALAAAYAGGQQMVASDPNGHIGYVSLFDASHDYVITEDEFAHNSFIASLFTPDVTLHDQQALSLGFSVHLAPCDAGRCATPPTDTCHDRIVDGDETDVDCGGSCGVCRGTAQCSAASDCESKMCNAGTCAAASCSDGVRDGFETDVDCGGNCGACPVGKRCYYDSDCQTDRCGRVGIPDWETCN